MAVGAGRDVSISDTDVAKIGVQYIGPVPGTRHPAIDNSFRRWLAGGNVFTNEVPGVTGGRDTVRNGAPVKARVVEIIMQPHVFGMTPGGSRQSGIITQGRQPFGASFDIDQINYLGFKVGINLSAKQKTATCDYA